MTIESTKRTMEKYENLKRKFKQVFQFYLDKSTPHTLYRWLALIALLLLYCIRVFLLQGFYIVTYGLGIFNLNLLLGFLTPQFDPGSEGPDLPTTNNEEFRPFVRKLPEFKFWQANSIVIVVVITLLFYELLIIILHTNIHA